jgi:hypothetical protein
VPTTPFAVMPPNAFCGIACSVADVEYRLKPCSAGWPAGIAML